MKFSIRQGTGGPVAVWDGRMLTSAYNSQLEVDRFCQSLGECAGRLIFVAGDPWGAAAKKLARMGACAVALLPGVESRSWLPSDVDSWAPEDGPLEDKLMKVWDLRGPEGVLWSVWPAFERLAPEVASDWGSRFRLSYRTYQGSWMARRRFGPRQWQNSLRNALDWETTFDWPESRRPILIAASGPSLDEAWSTLEGSRSLFDLWALPSTLYALVQRNLLPDAVVTTDAGFYAREHLHRMQQTSVPVWAGLSSAADPELAHHPTAFFSQGSEWERILLTGLTGKAFSVPSQGTVAITALKLALDATKGPVAIAGLDLAFSGRRGHCSPHSTDRRFLAQNGRLWPFESQRTFETIEQATARIDGTMTSPALLTYAQWLDHRAQFSRPILRVRPSRLQWRSMVDCSWSEMIARFSVGPLPATRAKTLNLPPRSERLARVFTSITHWHHLLASQDENSALIWNEASTAIPLVVSEHQRATRRGETGPSIKEALLEFLNSLAGTLS